MNPNNVSQFLNNYWPSKQALLVANLFVVTFEVVFFAQTGLKNWLAALIVVISCLIVCLLYWLSWIPPKAKKDKIGFVVSIACDPNDKEEVRVRDDFIRSLHKLVKSGLTGGSFHFIQVPQHIASQVVEPEDIDLLRVKTRAGFLLAGQVRLRKRDGADCYFVDLDGMVSHNPISLVVSDKLAQEFGELLPSKVEIPTDNDLMQFQFTSEWTEVVAKYIIGISASLSGDFDYAEILYSDSLSSLEHLDKNFHVYLKLSERIPVRLSEIAAERASNEYEEWAKTYKDQHIENLGIHLNNAMKNCDNPNRIVSLRAIYEFLANRDIQKAIQILKECPVRLRDATWFFNNAFLLAYKGDLAGAISDYQRSLQFLPPAEIFAKIEEFISHIIELEPAHSDLYYCLGFFNLKIKGDTIQAASDLKAFLSVTANDVHMKERHQAEKWLSEIT